MNSALQCLANTRFFYEYFIKDKRYIKQMNLKNKLGHQGELASNFAQLVWINFIQYILICIVIKTVGAKQCSRPKKLQKCNIRHKRVVLGL